MRNNSGNRNHLEINYRENTTHHNFVDADKTVLRSVYSWMSILERKNGWKLVRLIQQVRKRETK